MKEQDYIDAVNRPGTFQAFTYTKVDSPARAHKGKVTLTRTVLFTGKTGVDYANVAVVKARQDSVQPRKWGVRRSKYFVDHTPKATGLPTVYATVFAILGSFRTAYFVDGVQVTRKGYNKYRTASAAEGHALDDSGYMDIVLDTLTALTKAQAEGLRRDIEAWTEAAEAAEAEAEAAEAAA